MNLVSYTDHCAPCTENSSMHHCVSADTESEKQLLNYCPVFDL